MIGWNETTDAGAIVTGNVESYFNRAFPIDCIDYPWGELPPGSVVNDLGGGVGYVTMQLYKLYPNLNLKLQDLPERIEQAQNDIWPRECPEAIANGKIEFKSVDIMAEPPIYGCDIYLVCAAKCHRRASPLTILHLISSRMSCEAPLFDLGKKNSLKTLVIT